MNQRYTILFEPKDFYSIKAKKKKKEEKKYYKRKNVITLRNKTTLDIMKQIKIKNYFQIWMFSNIKLYMKEIDKKKNELKWKKLNQSFLSTIPGF